MKLAANDTQLSRLLYTSVLPAHLRRDNPAEMVRALIQTSAARNRIAGLTGSLVFVQNAFIQILEGHLEDIERTFEKICCDFRHTDVRLIDLIQVRQRIFGDWAMTGLCAGEEASLALQDDLQDVHFLVGVNAGETARRMRKLLEVHQSAAH